MLKIAAVIQVKDEVDIIACTVGHMLAQGVDHVWAMDWESTDGTREVLEDIDDVTVIDGEPLPFYWAKQGDYNTWLAALAAACGSTWIVPFDADEYWTGTHGRTVREAIEACTADRVQAQILQYADFDHRSKREYPWTKVAYRYREEAVICAGNHLISNGGTSDDDALLVHELKFRGFEHFKQKVQRIIPWDATGGVNGGGNPSLPTHGLTIGGTKNLYFDSTPTELADGWLWLQNETEECAIPSEFRP